MTTELKAALKLYKAYKCDTTAYRVIAEKLGMNTADLNKKCWELTRNRSH